MYAMLDRVSGPGTSRRRKGSVYPYSCAHLVTIVSKVSSDPSWYRSLALALVKHDTCSRLSLAQKGGVARPLRRSAECCYTERIVNRACACPRDDCALHCVD